MGEKNNTNTCYNYSKITKLKIILSADSPVCFNKIISKLLVHSYYMFSLPAKKFTESFP